MAYPQLCHLLEDQLPQNIQYWEGVWVFMCLSKSKCIQLHPSNVSILILQIAWIECLEQWRLSAVEIAYYILRVE